MTRLLVPLSTPDVSAFTKTLKNFLDERHADGKAPPSHVELLNLLARAAGMRNFATLKKVVQDAPPLDKLQPTRISSENNEAANLASMTPTVRKALLQFDDAGRLVRLPNKLSVQQLTMWALRTKFTGC